MNMTQLHQDLNDVSFCIFDGAAGADERARIIPGSRLLQAFAEVCFGKSPDANELADAAEMLLAAQKHPRRLGLDDCGWANDSAGRLKLFTHPIDDWFWVACTMKEIGQHSATLN